MAFSGLLYFILITAVVLTVLPTTEGKGGRGGGGGGRGGGGRSSGRGSGSSWFSFGSGSSRRSRYNPPSSVYSSSGHLNYHSSEEVEQTNPIVVPKKKPEDQFPFSTDYMLKDLENMRDGYLKLHTGLKKNERGEDQSDYSELPPSVLEINKMLNDMLDQSLRHMRELDQRFKP